MEYLWLLVDSVSDELALVISECSYPHIPSGLLFFTRFTLYTFVVDILSVTIGSCVNVGLLLYAIFSIPPSPLHVSILYS